MDVADREVVVKGIIEGLKSKGMVDDPDMCMLYTPVKDSEGYEPKRAPFFPFGITYERLYERVGSYVYWLFSGCSMYSGFKV